MQENKLGSMPIPKLVISLALPLVFTLFVQSLYGIVDSIFVSQIGQDALAAISLSGPTYAIMMAVGNGLALAVGTLISKSMGENDTHAVSSTATHGLIYAGVTSLSFAIIAILFIDKYYSLQLEVGSDIYNYCLDYQYIVFIISFGAFGQTLMSRLLQAMGKTSLSMKVQMVGIAVNLIFDPLLIHGYWIFPKLEVKGAAIATIMAQIATFAVGFVIYQKNSGNFRISFKGFRLSFTLTKKIYSIAIPSSLNMATTSLSNLLLSNYVLHYSTAALAAYGSYCRLQSFAFMPINGLNNALMPIIAYNYGAGNKKRVTNSFYFGLAIGSVILTFGMMMFKLFPAQLLNIFETTPEMMEVGIPMMKNISWFFLPVVLAMVFNSMSQGLVNSQLSLIVTIVKQIFVLPLGYYLSRNVSVDYFWFAFVISESCSGVSVLVCYRYLYKKVIVHIGEKKEQVKQKISATTK